jgi:hypothetical protein
MCNFIKTDGNQCKLSPKMDLCHRHINSARAPVAEPITVEFLAKIRSLSFEQKNEDVELIDDVEENESENIVSPMSPNTSSIITAQSEPDIVEAEKSQPEEINSTPGSYIQIEIFDVQDADKAHSVLDDIYTYKAFLKFVEEDGLSIGYFNKGEMLSLCEAGKSCVQYPFFRCS